MDVKGSNDRFEIEHWKQDYALSFSVAVSDFKKKRQREKKRWIEKEI